MTNATKLPGLLPCRDATDAMLRDTISGHLPSLNESTVDSLACAIRARLAAHMDAQAGRGETVGEEYDGTDAAHPAYWRGQDAGVAGACSRVAAALAGDIKGTCREPLQSLREKVAALRAIGRP